MASARSGSPERPGKVPAGTAGDEARADPPGAPRGPARRARGGVARFLLRRALMSAAVLAAVSAVVFAATEALPGDPAQAILGRSASPQALAAQEPVTRLLADRLVNSGFLVLVAAAFSIPLSVALGCYAAWRRDRAFDHGSSIVLLVLAGLPEFVVGVLAVVLLATTVLHVLPAVSYLAPGQRPWSDPSALALPVATLVIAVAPYVARVMRASMVEVMESDYVEMARLKGLPERTVLLRHALPNALGPVFQVIALNLAYLAGGIVVVEYVFAYPGVGSALQAAVLAHDLPVVQVLAMLIAGVYVAANLAADVATILVTPRMRGQL